jgi:hypothetical protein
MKYSAVQPCEIFDETLQFSLKTGQFNTNFTRKIYHTKSSCTGNKINDQNELTEAIPITVDASAVTTLTGRKGKKKTTTEVFSPSPPPPTTTDTTSQSDKSPSGLNPQTSIPPKFSSQSLITRWEPFSTSTKIRGLQPRHHGFNVRSHSVSIYKTLFSHSS